MPTDQYADIRFPASNPTGAALLSEGNGSRLDLRGAIGGVQLASYAYRLTAGQAQQIVPENPHRVFLLISANAGSNAVVVFAPGLVFNTAFVYTADYLAIGVPVSTNYPLVIAFPFVNAITICAAANLSGVIVEGTHK